jgi:hypothetical protein
MGIKVHTGESNGHSPGSYYRSSALAVIDVNSEESLSKWQEVLHLSRKELLEAISQFGPEVRNIRRGLLSSSDKAA